MIREQHAELAASLRSVPAFSDLSGEQTEWFLARADEVRFAVGDILIHAGEPADYMIVILEGEIEGRREGSGDQVLFRARAGEVTGMLPGSRLTHFPGTTRAATPVRLLRFPKTLFRELYNRVPQLGPRLISILTDRVRRSAQDEQQRQKLAALGKLSAGLAHELNNPASAVRQAAEELRKAMGVMHAANLSLAKCNLTIQQKERFFEMERHAMERLGSVKLDTLEQSDREQQMTEWLEQHGVAEAWDLAQALVESAFTEESLRQMAAELPAETLADALRRLTSSLAVQQLVCDIETGAGRISDLVQAIKEYTFMDQAPEQEVDIHKGLEATLTILGHKLKHGITVIREYDKTLPRVCARGSELNQVWTNLIDNAAGAMDGKGEIRIRTRRDLNFVVVEVIDNGPGIPTEFQPRIFEPFFTTKDVGEGTGLGLETVQRIVSQHRGEIRFESRPGQTRFEVRLPAQLPAPVSEPRGSASGSRPSAQL